MRSSLTWWNKNIFNKVQQRLRDVEDKIMAQDISLVSFWTIEKDIELQKLQALHLQTLKQEEIFLERKIWRQIDKRRGQRH